MKLLVTREALLRGLDRCSAAIEPRTTMPILQTVQLTASKDALQLAATSLTLTVDTVIVAKTEKAGAVCVDCTKLAALVRNLPPSTSASQVGVSLALGGKDGNEKLLVSSGSRRYQLATLPVDTFPKLYEPPADAPRIKLRAAQLSALIGRVEHASEQHSTSAALHAVRLSIAGDKLVALAISNHRVCEHTTAPEVPPGRDAVVVIPRQFVGTIRALTETLEQGEALNLVSDDQRIYAETDDALVSMLVPAEKFDNWDLLMERAREGAEPLGRVSCIGLTAALKAVTAVRSMAPVRLVINKDEQTLTLSITDPDGYDATDTVPFQNPAQDGAFSCEAQYLVDATRALDADFVVRLVPGMSLIMESDETFTLVMERRN
jgi:DNA polymerase-3 subunit beta